MLWILPFLIVTQIFAKTPDLWQVNIPIAANTAKEIQQALPQALTTVLVRASGQTTWTQADTLPHLNTEKAIQHYHISTEPCLETETLCTILHIQFKKAVIHQFLKELQLSTWSGTRPSSFINITVDDHGESITIDKDHALSKVIQRTADYRGIDIALPNPRSPTQPHTRRTSEQTLVSKLTPQEENSWQIGWQLYTPTELFEWTSSARNVEEALQASIDSLADFMVQQQQTPAEVIPKTESTLTIENIPDFLTLEKTLHTLKNHSHVQQIHITEENDNTITLAITHTTPLTTIVAAIHNLEARESTHENQKERLSTWYNNEATPAQ